MPDKPSMESKIYVTAEGRGFSTADLLNYFARQGSMRVSDLHLKVGCPPVYRVDGRLQRMKGPDLSADVIDQVIRLVLSEDEYARFDRDGSVDSSCMTELMQFRVNCFRDMDGPAVAVRALDADPPQVEQIGFPTTVWRDIVDRRQGLVLLTGITGAGKSTTIASLINRIARKHACRIITLEDPIEYRLTSDRAIISQREVGRDVPSFERGLRDALREDPDVIFVGEMRDRESTTWTLTAAETGHLVFSTLHTRNAVGSVTRLLDMFPPDRQEEVASQLSLGLAYVISQKLAPRSDGEGRVVAMEILQNTYAVANLIRTGKVEQIYTQMQTRTKDVPAERMRTLERSLAELVVDGVVTPHDAEKSANDVNTFLDELQRAQQRRENSA
ncbi:MAG: type IV pilus twitching motility protein PilT [Phycisphaerae bacterium]